VHDLQKKKNPQYPKTNKQQKKTTLAHKDAGFYFIENWSCLLNQTQQDGHITCIWSGSN